ncbi:hypothetical protein BJV77DRAFT_1086925 [Russula vinacea]|nr:hypothetical protein BJV77DRAFT_1086925 [Russula vinacea]
MAATVKATSSPPPAQLAQPQSQNYFEIVSSNFLKLGALPLEDFLRDPYQEPAPQENFLSNPLYHDVPLVPPLAIADQGPENGKPAPTPAPIFILDQICSQTFGSVDALNYETIEEEGKESELFPFLPHRPNSFFFYLVVEKRCILTITRPNGATRSYTSKPEFARKAEARAAAAAIAVDMGAIDFIKHGSPEAVAKRGLVLAPLDAPGSVQEPSATDAEGDPAVKEIEKCCVEWRAGRVKPRWIFLIDSKPTGNGPSREAAFEPHEDDVTSASPPVTLTLQGFFEALPRPLPEPVDDKTVAEINAPGWLNTLIQSARGGKFEQKFIWTTDTKLGTHGAVLRITRPDEVHTYMVDPQFPKRADAKNAVCLAALAAGVGAYVRAVSEALETKITPLERSLAYDSILPALTAEYAKFWPDKLPEMFEYTKDRDACGCIMTLKLTEEPNAREQRSWTISANFRNKNDAKVAVVNRAFERGALEFLRFRGESPPKDYKVWLPPPREAKKRQNGRSWMEVETVKPGRGIPRINLVVQVHRAALLWIWFLWAVESTALHTGRAYVSASPGYVDPKPEPGELPPEPPTYQPEHLSTNTPRWPTGTHPSFGEPPREYPPHRTAEPLLSTHRRSRSRSNEPGLAYSYGTREHGRRHQYELGDTRYDGPSLYASDPYYAPPPAPHAEPWHARPPISVYPEEEDVYRRSYRDVDYGRGYGYGYDYDYDYERDPYAQPPPPPPPASGPGGPGGRGYVDYERSGYDYDHGYSRERGYAHTAHPHMQYSQRPPPTLPPPEPAELTARPMSAPRIWVPAPVPPPPPSEPPPPSPPRVWKPGPRAAEVDARRSGARDPRLLSGERERSGPPEPPLPRTAEVVAEAALVPESTFASVSEPSSSCSTPPSARMVSASSKEELFEYCTVHGHPRPQFFDALDDSGGAAAVRHKVWVVLGSERLELPTAYPGVHEGEEKMARKVLRHLRSRNTGEAQQE